MTITAQQFKACLPYATGANLAAFLGPINEAIQKYAIDAPARLSCFLPQIAHESGCLKYVKEIADGKAYEGRRDLGNIQLGDGPKFKGRGLIQITGRTNYEVLGREFGIDLISSPELLESPRLAALSAGWFWNDRSLNSVADKPDEWTRERKGRVYNRFEWITFRINGGLNGLADRLKYYEIAKQQFYGKENLS